MPCDCTQVEFKDMHWNKTTSSMYTENPYSLEEGMADFFFKRSDLGDQVEATVREGIVLYAGEPLSISREKVRSLFMLGDMME